MTITFDPEKGIVIGKSGRQIGYIDNGYVVIKYRESGVTLTRLAHRLIWAYVHGPIADGVVITHKNGIRFDNRISNLQEELYSNVCVVGKLRTVATDQCDALEHGTVRAYRLGCRHQEAIDAKRASYEHVKVGTGRKHGKRSYGERGVDLTLFDEITVYEMVNGTAGREMIESSTSADRHEATVRMLDRGRSNAEIATRVGCSTRTITRIRRRISDSVEP